MKFVLEIHVVVTLCAYSVHTLSIYIRVLYSIVSKLRQHRPDNEISL